MNQIPPNYDGRLRTEDPNEPDYHVPGSFAQKLVFVIFSLAILALGFWVIWAPLMRLVVGERSEGRVVRIVRVEPGVEDEIIRSSRDISEQSHTVQFQHYVAVEREDGTEHVMRMGVDSARKPYAKVNDTFTVIHFPDDEFAFGAFHHRTWAFGAGYLSVGFILSLLSIHTLIMVGRKIPIDPESEENLQKEREVDAEVETWKQQRKEWLIEQEKAEAEVASRNRK
ncbi:MAG: hypothetical protein ACFBZ8_03200 [Opitutales bacterium]